MSYKNGKEVLPPKLLKELQKYLDGEFIYIPKKSKERAGWGELNGSRQAIAKRNKEIYQFYNQGISIAELEQMYHLTPDSIRKILYQMRAKEKSSC